MPKRPSRIDLLELDIDLRLADLWREAAEIDDWNLDVVAAFMRAAYGKGYCAALTEAFRPRVVHPELALEVDLAGGVAALLEQLARHLGTLPRRNPGRTKTKFAHGSAAYRRRSRASPGGSRTPGWHAGNKKKGVHGGNMVSNMCRPTLFLRFFHAETPEPH